MFKTSKGMKNAGLAGIIGALAAQSLAGLGAVHHWLYKMPKRSWRPNVSKYIPGGPHANVRGTYVRNAKQAANINETHEMIEFARQVRQSC